MIALFLPLGTPSSLPIAVVPAGSLPFPVYPDKRTVGALQISQSEPAVKIVAM